MAQERSGLMGLAEAVGESNLAPLEGNDNTPVEKRQEAPADGEFFLDDKAEDRAIRGEDPEPDDEQELEVSADEAEGDDQDEGDEETEESPIDPPVSWDADAKETFSNLPRELQEKVATRERQREQAISKAQQDAAFARRDADNVKTEITKRASELDQLLGTLRQVGISKWGHATPEYWKGLANENPDDYTRQHAEYQADLSAYNQAQAHQKQLAEEQKSTWLAQEEQKLLQAHPEYTDPTKRQADINTILTYTRFKRIQDNELDSVNAQYWDILLDAAKARQEQSTVVKMAKKKPPKSGAKPGKRVAPADRKTARSKQKLEKLRQSGRIEDLADLL